MTFSIEQTARVPRLRVSTSLRSFYVDFKYNATEYLRCGDRGQIDYPDAEIMRWTNKRKEGLLKILRRWRSQYHMKITLDAKKRTQSLGSQLSNQMEQMAKAMPHAPGAADELGMGGAGGCAYQTDVCLMPGHT